MSKPNNTWKHFQAVALSIVYTERIDEVSEFKRWCGFRNMVSSTDGSGIVN